MPKISHVGIVVLFLISEICNSLRVEPRVKPENEFNAHNLDLNPEEYVDPLEQNDRFDTVPEEDTENLVKRILRRHVRDLKEPTLIVPAKQRKTRQASLGYQSLYPQVPSSAPPYNPYQHQNNNHSGPSYPYQPVPQRPQEWNPNSYNYSNPNFPQVYPQKPSYEPNYRPYNASNGQLPYNFNPQYPSYNVTGRLTQNIGQNSSYNNHGYSGYPPQSSSYRPPNSTFNNFSQRPPYLQPGNTNPWQTPSNNNPGYPSSVSKHPVLAFNSTTQYPPYHIPGQYPSYNNSRPNYAPQWPSTPSYPSVRPNNASYGQYPQYPNTYPQHPPQQRNTTYYNGPAPSYPSTNGQYPGNFNPGYPNSKSSPGYRFADTYNPSIPSQPPHSNNYDQNFYYPQRNTSTTDYDPRKVQPNQFSYH